MSMMVESAQGLVQHLKETQDFTSGSQDFQPAEVSSADKVQFENAMEPTESLDQNPMPSVNQAFQQGLKFLRETHNNRIDRLDKLASNMETMTPKSYLGSKLTLSGVGWRTEMFTRTGMRMVQNVERYIKDE